MSGEKRQLTVEECVTITVQNELTNRPRAVDVITGKISIEEYTKAMDEYEAIKGYYTEILRQWQEGEDG